MYDLQANRNYTILRFVYQEYFPIGHPNFFALIQRTGKTDHTSADTIFSIQIIQNIFYKMNKFHFHSNFSFIKLK